MVTQAELEAIRRKQLRLLEEALRLSDGDAHLASALLHTTGSRWSLEFLIDGLDLFDATSEHIAAHLKKKDSKKPNGK